MLTKYQIFESFMLFSTTETIPEKEKEIESIISSVTGSIVEAKQKC